MGPAFAVGAGGAEQFVVAAGLLAGHTPRHPLAPSRGVAAAQAAVRASVAEMTEDRPLYRDIERTAELLASGALVKAVEKVVGPLA